LKWGGRREDPEESLRSYDRLPHLLEGGGDQEVDWARRKNLKKKGACQDGHWKSFSERLMKKRK